MLIKPNSSELYGTGYEGLDFSLSYNNKNKKKEKENMNRDKIMNTDTSIQGEGILQCINYSSQCSSLIGHF